MASTSYSIVHTEEFDAAGKRVFGTMERFDEISNGILFTVSNNPQIFPEIADTGIHVAKIAEGIFPEVSIYFKIHEDKIYLLDVVKTV